MFAQRANEAEPERSRLFRLIITLSLHRKVRNMQQPEQQQQQRQQTWLGLPFSVGTSHANIKQTNKKT